MNESLGIHKIKEIIEEKTRNFKDVYMDLTDSLTSLVDETVNYPVIEGDEDERVEGNVDEVLEKDTCLTISELNDAKSMLSEYNYLSDLTWEESQDHQFLRGRIREILKTHLKPNYQRRLIQNLMSRSYIERKRHFEDTINDTSNYGNINNNENNNVNIGNVMNDTISNRNINVNNYSSSFIPLDIDDDEVILTSSDKTPTYFNESEGVLGCEHYQRNCKIECFTCRKWFTCRFCHDNEIHDHQLDRRMIKHILCMYCNEPQQPTQNDCINCNRSLSTYFCEICKLYDNNKSKNIYHCDKCGICRLGVGLNKDYFHCDQCNACISISLLNSHRCIENLTRSNCPICDEYLFTTTLPVIFMKCGHPIHENCFTEHSNHDYKCPICKKSVLNMEVDFRMLDKEIENSVMPADTINWKTIIKCNDCDGMSNVKYHYLGHKCDHCNSYNTMIINIIKDENVELITPQLKAIEMTKASLSNNHSLEQNFQFEKLKSTVTKNNNKNHDDYKDNTDSTGDDYLVNNFIRVINNFEAYANISDAFKDWINASLPWEDDEDDNDEKELDRESNDSL